MILYEMDAKQIGRNRFTDHPYADHEEGIALIKRMIREKRGEGVYSFPDLETKTVVKKMVVWETVSSLINDWIVVACDEI